MYCNNMRIFETTRIECHYDSYHLKMARRGRSCVLDISFDIITTTNEPRIYTRYIYIPTAFVVWWSEFLVIDPEDRVRLPALPEKK
jgi:hypothetical protein